MPRSTDCAPTSTCYGLAWNELYTATANVNAAADSSQRVFKIPANLYSGVERIFFIDLELTDSAGHAVSRNFYWVPYTLTTFDWERTDYTHTPASRHEDLTALAHLPRHRSTRMQKWKLTRPRNAPFISPTTQTSFVSASRRSAHTPSGGLVAPCAMVGQLDRTQTRRIH